ncbi:MAG: phosphoribosylformylglycinamidine cyclo-ligase [Thermosynechococcaceae cyanobacterium MS004]|nr:phosphoribosylformylglycinamidine cyclo-ligase [Thermosynechococcaceae cyanobacterium MS004]
MDYRDAGVDVEAGRAFVRQIKDMVDRTARPEVLGGLGGFNGLFRLPKGYDEPVLVSGTDGVGTKLKLAHELDCHNTVGIDLVAMCVNDVLTCGAEPLFFLDYVATGKLEPSQLVQVVEGIAKGCEASGCALLGGETAEMPGFYQPKEYDLAGFCVGIVEHSQLLNGTQIQVGDVVVGLGSRGVHSNGYSLVRKVVAEGGFSWTDRPSLLAGKSLGEVFLTPTQIYVSSILAARKAGLKIHGMAHITGGGLPENLPRALSPEQSVEIAPQSWSMPPVFDWLAEAGSVSPHAMFQTFNMGIGFVVIVPESEVKDAIAHFEQHQIPAYAIGKVIPGSQTLLGLP